MSCSCFVFLNGTNYDSWVSVTHSHCLTYFIATNSLFQRRAHYLCVCAHINFSLALPVSSHHFMVVLTKNAVFTPATKLQLIAVLFTYSIPLSLSVRVACSLCMRVLVLVVCRVHTRVVECMWRVATCHVTWRVAAADLIIAFSQSLHVSCTEPFHVSLRETLTRCFGAILQWPKSQQIFSTYLCENIKALLKFATHSNHPLWSHVQHSLRGLNTHTSILALHFKNQRSVDRIRRYIWKCPITLSYPRTTVYRVNASQHSYAYHKIYLRVRVSSDIRVAHFALKSQHQTWSVSMSSRRKASAPRRIQPTQAAQQTWDLQLQDAPVFESANSSETSSVNNNTSNSNINFPKELEVPAEVCNYTRCFRFALPLVLNDFSVLDHTRCWCQQL